MDGGPFFYAVALIAAVLVGASKGGLPVVGMLGVPVLALATSPVHAAGLLLPIFVVSDLFVTLIVGLIGLAFSLNYWLRTRHAVVPHPADIPRGLFWGTISGFTS